MNKRMRTGNETCPRCDGPLPACPTLSQLDNATMVCSACGAEEDLHSMMWGGVPDFAFVIVGGNKYLKAEGNFGVIGKELA